MPSHVFTDVLQTLGAAALGFAFPITIGPIILLSHRHDALARLAGVFTVKPLAATPLWALILALRPDIRSDAQQTTSLLLTLVPGIGLTLLILWVFRRVYKLEPTRAYVLLGADVIRWLSTFVMLLMYPNADLSLRAGYYLLALAVPNAYAFLAAIIVTDRSDQVQAST